MDRETLTQAQIEERFSLTKGVLEMIPAGNVSDSWAREATGLYQVALDLRVRLDAAEQERKQLRVMAIEAAGLLNLIALGVTIHNVAEQARDLGNKIGDVLVASL